MKYKNLIQEIVNEASRLLIHINEEDMSHKPNPNKWSKKEILGHLIDSGYNNHRRLVQAQNQDQLIFDGYDQNLWVLANRYQDRKAKEIIQMWAIVNRHFSVLADQIPESRLLSMTSDHNFHKIGMRPIAEKDQVHLGMLIEDYIFHMEHHLGQIIDDYQRVSPFHK